MGKTIAGQNQFPYTVGGFLVDGDDFMAQTNILTYPQPYTCNNYDMELESYDETLIEVLDKEDLLNNFQYIMQGTLYMYVKALRKGSGEMVIRSIHYPDVKKVLSL